MKQEMRYSVVRRGTSLVLAATLATGMVPAIALAQDAGSNGATPVALSGKGLTPAEGKTYTAEVSWLRSDSDAASTMGGYFDSEITATYKGGKYEVSVTANATGAGLLSALQYEGKDLPSVDNADGTRTYTVAVPELTEVVFTVKVSAMPFAPSARMVVDQSSIKEVGSSQVDPYEAGFSLFLKGEDVTSKYGPSFQDKVKVTPGDNGYTVELTANSLGAGNTLGDITFAGVKVPKVVHEDGSATYSLPLPGVDGTYDITFGYTVKAGPTGLMTNLHPFQLVIGDATPKPSSVDRTGLTSKIVVAEKALAAGGKTDSANAALQKAIDDAYVAVDSANATDDSIANAITALSASVEAFNKAGGTDPKPGQGEQQVDKTALNAAIAKAKAIKQGNKTDKAFAALQEAIATAEKAAANDKIPQAGVNAATEQLNAAIEKFGISADKPSSSKTDFKLEQGKEYTVPAKLVKADGSDSMAAQYFEQNATVVWDGAHYKVRFGITAAGAEYIKGVAHAGADATSLGNNQYEVTVDSLAEAIELTFGLSTPVGDMQQTAYLSLDTTSLPTTSGEPIKPSNPNDNAGGNGGNNGQGNGGTTTTDPAGQKAEQGFQVGHTYQVPVSWLKQNSSETSMAAKYFGDTALVRPQSDGTFKVSFSATSEGANHIISLAYNGSDLAKSGNQYTVSIPKADSDTVVPISMTIKEMEQLGGGAQVADMHLKLSQAKDLGTGQDSVVASSSTTMAQTGDVAAGVAGAAAVAALVAGGVAVASRRRSKRQ